MSAAPPPAPAAPEPADDAFAPHAPAVRMLLRLPLFYKILIANAVLVLLGAVLGSLLTTEVVRDRPGLSPLDLAGLLAVAGVAATLLVNALILRVALSPLDTLEEVAARVQAGDLDARVPPSPVADREMVRLVRTFNAMLDTSEAYRQRLREVAARALDAAEEERKRIARELHDETAQTLAALLIRIRLLRRAPTPEATDELLDDMREEIDRALEGVRRFARGLRPPALDELGLVPAIEQHVRSLADATRIAISVDAEPLEAPLSPQAELALYRIVQEAISNALRHAGASRIEVRIGRSDGAVVVRVVDDGVGFDPDAVMARRAGGMGLFGMQERAGYLNGRVTVRSRRGSGTEVRAEVPFAEAAG